MKQIHWLTSLSSVKQHLNKSNTTNDSYLEMLISTASGDIEAYCHRNLRVRDYGNNGIGADYYNGDGSGRLFVNHFPIVSVTSLYDDLNRDFTSTYLKASTDYVIWRDEGMIQLLTDAVLGSSFSLGIQNVKLIYTAGYGEVEIITEVNDKIGITDDDGLTTVTVDSGVYTCSDLATEIQSKINDATTQTWAVSYNNKTAKFTLAASGSVAQLNWTNSAIIDRNIGASIGFDTSADDTGSTSYEADNSILGIPSDLEMACLQLVERYWNDSKLGAGRFDIDSKTTNSAAGSSTVKFSMGNLPNNVARLLSPYVRRNI